MRYVRILGTLTPHLLKPSRLPLTWRCRMNLEWTWGLQRWIVVPSGCSAGVAIPSRPRYAEHPASVPRAGSSKTIPRCPPQANPRVCLRIWGSGGPPPYKWTSWHDVEASRGLAVSVPPPNTHLFVEIAPSLSLQELALASALGVASAAYPHGAESPHPQNQRWRGPLLLPLQALSSVSWLLAQSCPFANPSGWGW